MIDFPANAADTIRAWVVVLGAREVDDLNLGGRECRRDPFSYFVSWHRHAAA